MSRGAAELQAEPQARPPAGRRERGKPPTRRGLTTSELGLAGAQLATLTAFALAQPLFDILSRNAEFFAVRGSMSRDIVLFALALTLLPPLVLVALEAVAGLVDRRLRLGLHLLFVAGFVGLFATQALKKIDGLGSSWILVGAGLLMAVAVAGYCRLRTVRRLLALVAPASILFLALFLFFSPVRRLVFPPHPQVATAAVGSAAEAPPIVLVVLDEFPVTAIMAANREIDPVRYPNIAALARGATWFRNATTVSPETVQAVPALLTGLRPREKLLPVFAEHPRNLFTLLGGKYRLNVHETETHLCHRDLCHGGSARESFGGRMKSLFSDVGVLYAHMVAPPRYERELPSIATGWGDFLSEDEEFTRGGREKLAGWKAFLASIRASRRPGLNFDHLLLPHEPWRLLPSCRTNVFKAFRRHTPGLPPGELRWARDEWLVLQAQQRLLLQTQCVDVLVGQLIRRLRRIGIYDSSLVILVSDHGVSVRPGQWRRRIDPDSPTNLADLAFPVLLVKRPGQERGEVVDRHVETIDVVPTISETSGVAIPWAVDGHSFWDEQHEQPQVTIFTGDGLATAPVISLEQKRDALLQRQVRFFGERDDEPGVYGIGPHPELIGRPVSDLQQEPSTGLGATLAGEVKALLADWPRGSRAVPTPIYGSLEGDEAGERLPIAVAVNGRIAAVSWTDGSGSETYSAFVPEAAFRPGRNRVAVFAIEEGADGVTLARLGSA